ncbi:MAG TPA: hypothetical protein VF502_16410 [Stellaceae bacterium]
MPTLDRHRATALVGAMTFVAPVVPQGLEDGIAELIRHDPNLARISVAAGIPRFARRKASFARSFTSFSSSILEQ